MATLRVLLTGISTLFACLLAVPIIVIGLPFLAVGVLTQAIASLLEPRFMSWSGFLEFDPTFGWKNRDNVSTYHISDDLFLTTTDAQGWRGKSSISESQIIFFGDSFAFGYGIDDKNFFADLNPDLRIKAIGSCGYNMVQELLWMQQLSSELTGKLVVWAIYFGNDLYENLTPDMGGYRLPFVREVNGSGEWEIVTSHISPAKWFTPAGRRYRNYYRKLAELCSPTFLSQRAYSACEFLLWKGKELCEQSGAQLVALTIPDTTQLTPKGLKFLLTRGQIDPKSFDPDFPDQNMRDICKKLGIPFVATKEHLAIQHYNKYDCHWNKEGHRRIAALLARLYHEHVIVEHQIDVR